MTDIGWIADALADARDRDTSVVLASVVRTEGSTYRRAGARLLVGADGATRGVVSGGCLEPDLALRAGEVLAGGAPALVTYDTRAGDDVVWGLGLGCNGRVDVLLEPLVGQALARAAALYVRCRDLDGPAVLSTVFAAPAGAGAQPGDRVLVPAAGDDATVPHATAMAGDGAPDAMPRSLRDVLARDARAALRSGRSTVARYGVGIAVGRPNAAPPADCAVEVLHEVLRPPIALLVCGAGPDAGPLVRAAAALGWRVTVADDRPGHARPARFPEAAGLVLDPAAPATARGRGRRAPARAAAVVMTHHYARDRAHLAALLATDVAYVGVLGPRRRTARLLADLGAPEAMPRLHAPVGLDLGAETPEEIALAIVAEVAAAVNGRPAAPLRARAGGIHDAALPALSPAA